MWLPGGDLQCSTCGATFRWAAPRVLVLDAARAHGWHTYEGPSLSGKPLESHLCKDCVDAVRKQLQPVAPVDGYETLSLFDVKAGIDSTILANTPEPVDKPPRAPRKQPPRVHTRTPQDEGIETDE